MSMETKIVNTELDIKIAISLACEQLDNGEVIAIPTDTVYGFACDIFNLEAVSKIFNLKNRTFQNPLTAFIRDPLHAEELCKNIPDSFYNLANNFFPGALSIVLEKKYIISDLVTGGKPTLSVRIPEHDFIIKLLNKYRNPLATTSANLSQQPAILAANDIYNQFSGKISLILDGGHCKFNSESTVISIVNDIPIILRQGVISKQEIENALGREF